MNPVVTPLWLAERLQNPDTVVLDATLPPVGVMPPINTHARYLEKHIPGAVFFDIDAISDQTTTLPHMLPSPEVFSRSMSALGVGDAMTVVIYEQEGLFSSPRAWWALRTFGAKNVYLLDGGLHGWLRAGFAVESGGVQRDETTFTAALNPDAVKVFSDIQRIISDRDQILDARSAGRFNGTSPEPRPGIASGHMPYAINTPFLELLDGGRLKPPDELRQLFTASGVDLHRPITTTCGSGVTAAVLQLALEVAGAQDVSLYDGSWAEYAQQPRAVIVTAG